MVKKKSKRRYNLKPFLLVTKKWYEGLKAAYSESSESEVYKNLGPTKSAVGVEAYIDTLDNVLRNDEIKNIAVTGSYGSGKSSVLLTFFDSIEYSFYNPINISLAAYRC